VVSERRIDVGAKTGIEWTDATWNPLRGCSRVSEGCRHCYAESVAYRFSGAGLPYEGLAVLKNGHASWTGKVDLVEKHLLDPLKWGPVPIGSTWPSRSKEQPGVWRPRRIFVNSMSDLFHEAVPDEWIDKIFAVMALCPQHQFQVLTKRPKRMLAYFTEFPERRQGYCWRWHVADAIVAMDPERTLATVDTFERVIDAAALENVWLGVSVENQAAADERIPLLLKTPAAVRFISAEPLLGPVSLARWTDVGLECECGWRGIETEATEAGSEDDSHFNCPICYAECSHTPIDECLGGRHGLNWVICGGESGPGARPMHPDWARGLRDQCKAAGAAFFFKQWGEWLPLSDYEPFVHGKDTKRYTHQFLWKAGEKNDSELPISAYCVGKHAAGALLEGEAHKGFPMVMR